MTNNQIIQLPPQTLQRVEKLKVYAILSGEKGEALVAVKNKLVISLVLAYNDTEALIGAKESIAKIGKKPEEYQTPFMITHAVLEELIPNLNQNKHLVGGEVEASPGDVIEFVKEMFNVVGTANQKKSADAVIEKYKKHVKFLPKVPKVFFDYGPDEAN